MHSDPLAGLSLLLLLLPPPNPLVVLAFKSCCNRKGKQKEKEGEKGINSFIIPAATAKTAYLER